MAPDERVESVHEEPGEGDYGLLELIRSDYRRFCVIRDRRLGTDDADRPNLLIAVLKHLTNTQLRAQVLFRLTCASPRPLHWLFRSLLNYLHSSEIGYGAKIGPEFRIPHPSGIVIGGEARIGRNVGLAQNVTLGSNLQVTGQPIVEDDVIIMAGAMIAGPVRIGRGALIGANSVVMEDIPAGGLCGPARLRIIRGRGVDWSLRRRGIDPDL